MKTTGKWTVTATRNGTVFSGLSKGYARELAASLRAKGETVTVREPAARG